MNENKNAIKLPKKVKLSYCLLTITPNMQNLFQIFYLVYFYVNVLQIGATAAGLIIMVARIWDFINDPMMGILVEKTTKPQKCIYWMKRALPLIIIFMILCYFAPNFSNGAKIVWALITYICLGMSQTMYSIPDGSLRARLTEDRDEQSKLNVYMNVFSALLNILVPMVTMPLASYMQGYGENTAFMKVAAIYGAIMLISTLIGLRGVDGYDHDDIATKKKSAPTAGEMIKALVTNPSSMVIIGIQAVKMLLSSLSAAVLVYFCTYVLGDVNIMSIQSAIGSIPSYIAIACLVFLFRKFGNAGTGILGSVWTLVTFGLLVLAYVTGHMTPTVYLVLVVINGFGNQLVSSMIPVCLVDSLIYSEYKTGSKNTGVIMAASGIGQKIGMAFGSSVAALIMGLLNFDPNAATQPQNILNAFFHLTITTQLVVYTFILIAFIVIYRIEKQIPEMQAAIAERKAAEAAEEAEAGAAETDDATAEA